MERESRKSRAQNEARTAARKWHVLCIEDDPHSQELLLIHLREYFDSITIAVNGREGLNLIEEKTYEIIFSDIKLPDVDGLEIAQRAKTRDPNQVMVMISAHSTTQNLLQAIELGVEAFIVKPFTGQQVASSIERAIRQVKLAQDAEEHRKSLEVTVEQKERQLTYQYMTDSVTGAFNRAAFMDRIREGHQSTLLLINLDNFSQINYGYGFGLGDQVLRSVAAFLGERTPENGSLYRLQSDEFLILIESTTPGDDLVVADRIITELPRAAITVEDVGIKVGATIGLAHGQGEELLTHASLALLEARKRGRNRFEVYKANSDLAARQQANLNWITRIKHAIEYDQLVPFFQPIFHNNTGKVAKYECLIRLLDSGEVISPGQFLGPAKMAGLLPVVTGIVVEKAFPLLKDLDGGISINITDEDFRGAYLPEYLFRKVEELELDPGRVTLEILEDIDPSVTSDRLAQVSLLKEYGFKIALDDFGVSGSNFSRIASYNPDYIKIDGAFIKDINEDENHYKIARAITQFAQSIGASVIAEFVHNQETQDTVKSLGIEYSQGFFLGEPVRDPK